MPYTYLWLREDGTPYYVGKGSGNRAFYRYSRKAQPPSTDRIIVQQFDTEQEAFEAEIFLISYFGRIDNNTGILHNFSDGGEGPLGTKRPPRSEEWKRKQREVNLGRKHSEEHKEKISRALKGTKKAKFSDEHKRKISESGKEAARKRVYTPELREKLRQAAHRRWSI